MGTPPEIKRRPDTAQGAAPPPPQRYAGASNDEVSGGPGGAHPDARLSPNHPDTRFVVGVTMLPAACELHVAFPRAVSELKTRANRPLTDPARMSSLRVLDMRKLLPPLTRYIATTDAIMARADGSASAGFDSRAGTLGPRPRTIFHGRGHRILYAWCGGDACAPLSERRRTRRRRW